MLIQSKDAKHCMYIKETDPRIQLKPEADSKCSLSDVSQFSLPSFPEGAVGSSSPAQPGIKPTTC